MKTISLYPNLKRDADLSCTRFLACCLAEKGARVLVSLAHREALSDLSETVSFVSEEALFTDGDCIVPLGGDGTILSIARRAAEADIPIFGVNLGHVGFMAALEKNQLSQITRLLDGDVFVSSRMLIACSINSKEELLALNECVIAPDKGIHIVELSLFDGKRKICDFRADGLIFNTPTGSTGYSFSAGGAVIDSDFDCIGVKAISSYLLINSHHMVFKPETVFTVKNIRSEGSKVTVCADGREERVLREGDVVRLARSNKRVKLMFLKPKSNLEVFFRKF